MAHTYSGKLLLTRLFGIGVVFVLQHGLHMGQYEPFANLYIATYIYHYIDNGYFKGAVVLFV